MELQTKVEVKPSLWKIEPCARMLFVGSCFADNVGHRFQEELFRAVVNPYGVMYNPISVLHTVTRLDDRPPVAVVSLGTNHVYIDKAAGEVVDNCRKRPASDFEERELSVDECFDAIAKVVEKVRDHVILTVSPIRYRKYGYHGSQLSKATLLLAVDRAVRAFPGKAEYFPSYEIVCDELRDYRFYEPDMLHPSRQTVEYIFERFGQAYFSKDTLEFLRAWRPLKEALGHRPSDQESPEYKAFIQETWRKIDSLRERYPDMDISQKRTI